MIFVFLALLLADNIEIPRNTFDVLDIEGMLIHSAHTGSSTWTTVKISFPGHHRYEIYEPEKRYLVLIDETEYLKEREPMVYRIDFETRYYGLIPEAWTVIAVVTVTSAILLFSPNVIRSKAL